MPYTLDLVARCAAAVRETGVYGGVLQEARLLAALGRVHEHFDALLCPTLALPALDAGDDYVDGGPTVDGQRLAHYFEMLLTIPFNVAGRNPVLAVPSGRGSDGVPTGVQIVGRTYDDDTVFHAGAALERAGFGFGGDPDWGPSSDPPSATRGDAP